MGCLVYVSCNSGTGQGGGWGLLGAGADGPALGRGWGYPALLGPAKVTQRPTNPCAQSELWEVPEKSAEVLTALHNWGL